MDDIITALKLSNIPRIEKLKLCLKYKGLTYRMIAPQVGLHAATVGHHCANETMPTKLHRQLVRKWQIPEEFLPLPKDLKPGPKGGPRKPQEL